MAETTSNCSEISDVEASDPTIMVGEVAIKVGGELEKAEVFIGA